MPPVGHQNPLTPTYICLASYDSCGYKTKGKFPCIILSILVFIISHLNSYPLINFQGWPVGDIGPFEALMLLCSCESCTRETIDPKKLESRELKLGDLLTKEDFKMACSVSNFLFLSPFLPIPYLKLYLCLKFHELSPCILTVPTLFHFLQLLHMLFCIKRWRTQPIPLSPQLLLVCTNCIFLTVLCSCKPRRWTAARLLRLRLKIYLTIQPQSLLPLFEKLKLSMMVCTPIRTQVCCFMICTQSLLEFNFLGMFTQNDIPFFFIFSPTPRCEAAQSPVFSH